LIYLIKGGFKMDLNIKNHVNKGKKVHFQFYRMNVLYYKTELGLTFEIPISDTGTGTFPLEDKAINYMRWIRKQIEKIKEVDFV
jgi:hypothetical protein